MADNTTLNAMSGGDSVGADEISGVKYQRIKLIHGADGTNDGDVSTSNGLPVQVATALPAGTNAIGKLAANSGVDIGDTDVTSVTPGTTASSLGKAEDAAHTSGDVGVMALGVANVAQSSFGSDGDYTPMATDLKGNTLITGNIAHDGVDAGNPVLNGYRSIAHGANPTAVAAADRTVGYANRHGIPFFISGHPNTLTASINVTDADGAQTDTAIITVSSGSVIVVTWLKIIADGDNSGTPAYRIGFGASNTPAADAAGLLAHHTGIKAGGGEITGNGGGILGVGTDGQDLRLTCEDPVAGGLTVIVGYFTIES